MNTLTHRLRDGLALIGITAVLAAILLPLARHYGSLEDETCLSNLRQIGQAHRLYEMDYEDRIVPYVLFEPAGSKRWTSLIAPRLTDPSVFDCPLDNLDPSRINNVPYPTTYGCNWYLSSSAGVYMGTPMPARPYGDLKDPGATIRLADTAFILKSTMNGPPATWKEDLQAAPTADIYYFYLPQNPLTGTGDASWPGSSFSGAVVRPFPRHGGHVNVSFYDGHAAAVPGSQFDPKVTRYGNTDCLWDNVAGTLPYTFAEAAKAIRVAAGIEAPLPADVTRLDVDAASPGVDMGDAARLAHKAAGLEANP